MAKQINENKATAKIQKYIYLATEYVPLSKGILEIGGWPSCLELDNVLCVIKSGGKHFRQVGQKRGHRCRQCGVEALIEED